MKKKHTKKTKKIKKKKLKLGRVFVLVCFIIMITLAIYNADKLKARSVAISGNKLVKSSEIIKVGNLDSKVSFISSSKKTPCAKIKKMPLIKSCKIKRTVDLKMTINVQEETPIFYYMNTEKLTLESGKQVSLDNTYGVPNLINYVPKDVLDEFILKISKIDRNILMQISEIEYTPTKNKDGEIIDDKRFMLSMNDGNIVYINNKHLHVLNEYEKIYSTINNAHGIFNFDCDYNNYYFQSF